MSNVHLEEDDWTLDGGDFPHPDNEAEWDEWYHSHYLGFAGDRTARYLEHQRRDSTNRGKRSTAGIISISSILLSVFVVVSFCILLTRQIHLF